MVLKKFISKKKEFLYEENDGRVYFVNPFEAIIIGDDGRTIWLNVNLKNYSTKSSLKHYLPIKRVSKGTSLDFQLEGIPLKKILQDEIFYDILNVSKFIELDRDGFFFQFIQENSGADVDLEYAKLTLMTKMSYIYQFFNQLNEKKSSNPARIEFGINASIIRSVEKFNDTDINSLEEFYNFLENWKITRKNTRDLLDNPNMVLIAGDLIGDEYLHYNPMTRNKSFVEQDLNELKVKFDEYFKDLIIDPNTKNSFFNSINLVEILNGEIPPQGGAILIDSGGTGKSLLVSRMEQFLSHLKTRSKKKGALVKRRGEGDITSYVNAGPQLIQRWYTGSKVKDVISNRSDEYNLVQEAVDRGVPSFLIIDEAQKLIEKEDNSSGGDRINAINSWKKFIQDRNKGGVTGFVITILIANTTRDKINGPLSQSGERLTVIEIGHPKNKTLWIDLLKLYFKNIQVEEKEKKLEIFAQLLLYHLSVVKLETNSPSPREVESMCKNFLNPNSSLDPFAQAAEARKGNREQSIDNFHNFLEFIKSKLIEKLNSGENIKNGESLNSVISNYEAIISKLENINQEETRSSTSTEEIIKEWEEKKKLLRRCIKFIDKNSPPQNNSQIKANNNTNRIIMQILEFLYKNIHLFSQITLNNKIDEKKNILLKTHNILQKTINNKSINMEEFNFKEQVIRSIIDNSFFQ